MTKIVVPVVLLLATITLSTTAPPSYVLPPIYQRQLLNGTNAQVIVDVLGSALGAFNDQVHQTWDQYYPVASDTAHADQSGDIEWYPPDTNKDQVVEQRPQPLETQNAKYVIVRQPGVFPYIAYAYI